MKNWKNVVLREDATILDAIQALQSSALQIALILDEKAHLKGTVTDGDIRRAILESIPMDSLAMDIACTTPTVGTINDGRDALLRIISQASIRQLPILDNTGKLVGLETLFNLVQKQRVDNPVVLMAGGLGTRLMPLTSDCPKPLLKVGHKPILETILENFMNYGFWDFYISINYRGEMIEKHFGDGSRWGISIKYLREEEAMGTAGALAMLPRPNLPFITMNGDLLTKINFQHLLDFHEEHDSLSTMCVREYELQVPFGVVTTDKERLVSIEEKPMHEFYVNAGIYAFTPKALDYLADGKPIDMPTLFSRIIEDGGKSVVYPIREYWMDIGRMSDFEQANSEYRLHFSERDCT